MRRGAVISALSATPPAPARGETRSPLAERCDLRSRHGRRNRGTSPLGIHVDNGLSVSRDEIIDLTFETVKTSTTLSQCRETFANVVSHSRHTRLGTLLSTGRIARGLPESKTSCTSAGAESKT